MRPILIVLLLMLPLGALAQSYSKAPLVVVQQRPHPRPAQEAPLLNPAPAAPSTPAAPTSEPAPASAKSPDAVIAPHGKLWPSNTIPLFMTSCTKFHVEMVEPCGCIIRKVMTQFPHDEFMRIDAAGQIETDPRLQRIRQECADAIPAEKKKNRPLQGNGS